MNLAEPSGFTQPLDRSSATSVKKPDFFIVGAPKCATTSMHYYLKQHPDVFMSVPKEPFFFGSDLDSHRLKTRDPSEYRSFFEGSRGFDHVGESTVWYLYSETAAREIKEFSPGARIIIMLRHPVDAMHALHSQFLFSGNESIEDFEQALEAEERRSSRSTSPETVYYPDGLLYSEVYHYPPQIRRYFETFGRSRVKILTLGDLKRDPKACYQDVLEFLGARAFNLRRYEPRNANCKLKSSLLRHVVREVPGYTLETLRDILPVRPCAELWEHVKPMLVDPMPRPSLDLSLRRRLVERFRPSILELQSLLNRDFSTWLDETASAA